MPTPKLPPLEFDEVSELVCFLQRQPHDPAAVQRILRDKLQVALDLSPGAPRPHCALPLITALRAAAARPKADPRLRKALGVWRLIPPGNWLVHSTASFEIHYTHEPGPNQVQEGVVTVAEDVYTHSDGLPKSYPTRLVGTLDPNLPAPRFVQELGFFFEDALTIYGSLGFDLPAAPVQVYVAQCPGDMGYSDPADNVILIGPMNYDAGGSLGQVTAHELFHLVQYRYYVPPPNTLHPTYWYEGSADAAISLVNPNFTLWSCYESCTPLEGASSYPYATVILWRYLMEQLTKSHDPVDSPPFGADILRHCWECARQQQAIDTPTLAVAVNALTPANVTFADFVFGNNGELLSNETIWGNWPAAWYLKDLQPPVPDSRFCYLPIPRFMLESAPVTACAVGDVVTASLQPWDVSYQEVTLSGAAQPLSLGISAVPASGSGDPQCLVQVLIISDSGSLLDIIRTTSANYQRIIGAPYGSGTTMGTVGKVVLILGTRSVAANFTCSLQAAAAAPDLMITRRDSPAGCEYQSNWHNASRDSNTPDIWVIQTRPVRTKVPMYRLRVRVRNKGNAAAGNVTVALAIAPSGAHSAVKPPLGWPLLGTIAFPPIPANAEVVGTMVVKPPKLTVVPKRTPVHPTRSTVRLLVSATIVAASDTSLENNAAFREFRLELP